MIHPNGTKIDHEFLLLPKFLKEQLLLQVSSFLFSSKTTIFILVDGIKEYKWKKVSKIVDTHGCGDALAGGLFFPKNLSKE